MFDWTKLNAGTRVDYSLIATLATVSEPVLAASSQRIQTGVVTRMSISSRYRALFAAMGLLFAALGLPSRAQDPSPAPASQASPAKADAKPEAATAAAETPAQIELLETKIRFEANGDSRKEVHTRVHINTDTGAQQFSRLNFNFDEAIEKIEIPEVHITHASGGSADILASAITDQQDPALSDYPNFQNIRVKSVRILGLAPSDVLEYRVVTTGHAHALSNPFLPRYDFWFDHSFARTSNVAHETFSLDLPAARFALGDYPAPDGSPKNDANRSGNDAPDIPPRLPQPQPYLRVWSSIPENSKKTVEKGGQLRVLYMWDLTPSKLPESTATTDGSDVVLTTFSSWSDLAHQMTDNRTGAGSTADWIPYNSLYAQASRDPLPARVIYSFVAKRFATLELPAGAQRNTIYPVVNFQRDMADKNAATPYQKVEFFFALMSRYAYRSRVVYFTPSDAPEKQLPRPSLLTHILVVVDQRGRSYFLDPSLDVAPFGLIRADFRGKKTFDVLTCAKDTAHCWQTIPLDPPFPSTQRVRVEATLAPDGTLDAKVHYSMRGDNELQLRMAFYQTPRAKWNEVAQLLALSDGFRGKITSAHASDPRSTDQPFAVDYEISQPKFVDWTKKPVRIPAPLPLLAVPDLPGKAEGRDKTSSIDLGTPLDADTRVTLRLPTGTSVEIPTGTVVDRDYATFAARYDTESGTVTAIRHINFIHRQVTADRAPDYAAFLHAVQTDQAQLFTLTRADVSSTTAASTQQKP